MFAYAAFGLRIVSTGPLPGLPAVRGPVVPDVTIVLQRKPPSGESEALYRSPDSDETGTCMLTVERLDGGALFRFRYADGIEFVVASAGDRVWAVWPEPWTIDDVATYLLGPVAAFCLRLRGMTCLHASAVAVDARAVVFVGPVGAGKSTVAAAFARRAYAFISDDVVALTGDGFVQPGPPRVRLWPESVAALYGSADALPRLTPTWDKRFLEVMADGYRFQDQPLPLAALYVLAGRASGSGWPRVEVLAPAAGLMALLANTQASHLLDGRMRAEEFRCLGRVAASLRVCRLTVPDDLAALPALCDAVVEDVLDSAVHV